MSTRLHGATTLKTAIFNKRRRDHFKSYLILTFSNDLSASSEADSSSAGLQISCVYRTQILITVLTKVR
jgi:hypothetical protein